MPKTLSAVAIASFDAMVHVTYQGEEKLAGTVRKKTGVIGTTHQFSKFGKGLARKRTNPFSKVVPMNAEYDKVTAAIEEYDASEWNSLWEATEVDFEEKSLLAQCIRQAMERRKDQLIIDALDAASTALTVSINQGGTNSGLNVSKLRRTNALLDDKGVPSTQRHFAAHVFGKEQLLGETQVTSADYNSVRALVNGDVNSFLGFNYHWLETRDEGGLDLTSHSRQNFAWHQMAVGLAEAKESEIEINYIPENKSWLNSKGYKAGAIAIDANGIAEIATYE